MLLHSGSPPAEISAAESDPHLSQRQECLSIPQQVLICGMSVYNCRDWSQLLLPLKSSFQATAKTTLWNNLHYFESNAQNIHPTPTFSHSSNLTRALLRTETFKKIYLQNICMHLTFSMPVPGIWTLVKLVQVPDHVPPKANFIHFHYSRCISYSKKSQKERHFINNCEEII